ncbi:beta-ketoacyl synthase N-terminal-like domain-containing protein [Streptomyces sp. WAC05374]|uniref:beta-ketoacyl synthase N-terminal-like domain-containing protein n=1 Tax=Streptomyces sp. WAC05374 TaxID=2487420 RepID=UPI001F17728D|nr:beta-ketoacyl synthase N-terminal-like domain-containing protein [Streptomyces sp. WAC05374]
MTSVPHPAGHRPAPIAVIGMSCRFPGAGDPAHFWRNLVGGVDSVGAVPPHRWTDTYRWSDTLRLTDRHDGTASADGAASADSPASVTSAARRGGFVDDVEGFDAGFFGVSPREARSMDPQQRLLMELAWEALEDAAIPAAEVHGSRWGVFVGASADDFRVAYLASGALDRFGHTGSSRCMLANRVSHHLGLRGPSEVVDTGQSSSLAAVHRALIALRTGECEAAVVAGVHLNLLQRVTDQIQLWGGLSRDGHCRTFDAGADGYVRGEGGGCVVLKPLDAALRDGDPVQCVVLAGATSNDGGRGGLTVPSADAQYEAMTAAHAAAGVTPDDIVYVELHGTGTPVGDPVEASAVGAAVGRGRPQGSPVRVGSVKTNIGHLESAAGMAGFLKACLMLRYGQLPPTLHHRAGNPAIAWQDLNIEVVTSLCDRPFEDGEAVGVSSFGMGGTNVHVILGPAPSTARERLDGTVEEPTVWCLSGRTPQAVRELAAALLDHPFPAGQPPVGAVARALVRRTHFEHRAAVVGSGWTHFREGLAKVAAGHGFAVPADLLAVAGADGVRCVEAASAYVHGGDSASVRALVGDGPRGALGLPTYRFSRETFPLPGATAHAVPEPDAWPVPVRDVSPARPGAVPDTELRPAAVPEPRTAPKTTDAAQDADTHADRDTGTDQSTGTRTGTGTDQDTNADRDTGTGTGTDRDTNANRDTGTDQNTGTDRDTNADRDTGTDQDTDADRDTDANAADTHHPASAPVFRAAWLRTPPGADREWLVRSVLERELAVVLGGPVAGLDPEASFTDQGIDSMSLIEFLDRIVDATALDLSETVLFDHPTLSELAQRVDKEMESEHG